MRVYPSWLLCCLNMFPLVFENFVAFCLAHYVSPCSFSAPDLKLINKEVKQQLIIWEKIFENDVSERGPVSRAYKEHLQLNDKRKNNLLTCRQRVWTNVPKKKLYGLRESSQSVFKYEVSWGWFYVFILAFGRCPLSSRGTSFCMYFVECFLSFKNVGFVDFFSVSIDYMTFVLFSFF